MYYIQSIHGWVAQVRSAEASLLSTTVKQALKFYCGTYHFTTWTTPRLIEWPEFLAMVGVGFFLSLLRNLMVKIERSATTVFNSMMMGKSSQCFFHIHVNVSLKRFINKWLICVYVCYLFTAVVFLSFAIYCYIIYEDR